MLRIDSYTAVRGLVDKFVDANPWLKDHLLEILIDPPEYKKLEKHRGFYRYGKMVVFASNCTKPGHGYSWPGHKADRTLLGVAAHELGHHWMECKARETGLKFEEVARVFFLKVLGESGVTSYGDPKKPDEDFAESFRLFVTNPDLLRIGRPLRYKFMTRFGVKPIETRDYLKVLGPDFPSRFQRSLGGFIKQSEVGLKRRAKIEAEWDRRGRERD